jgi:hypothetical protein
MSCVIYEREDLIQEKRKQETGGTRHTLRMVLRARVETFTRTFFRRASEKSRLDWMLGSHARRVFFFENGTLFPYCFVFPWNKPSCERLKGWVNAAARDGKEGNMGVTWAGVTSIWGLVRCELWKRSHKRAHGGPKRGRSEPRLCHSTGHKCTQFLHTSPLRGSLLAFSFVEVYSRH